MKIVFNESRRLIDHNKAVSLPQPEARSSAINPTEHRDETVLSREARNLSNGGGIFSKIADTAIAIARFGKDDKKTETKDSRRAEDKDENATIAVFDEFYNADEPGVSTHGERVEGVLQQKGGLGDEDIQRYQINEGSGHRFGDDAYGLHDLVESCYSSLLDDTSDSIEEILNDKDSKITTINQSQYMAGGLIAEYFWSNCKENPKFLADLTEHLGLDPKVSERELAQTMVNAIGDVVSSSDIIAESQERFHDVSKRASEAGITHVVCSGNLGSIAGEFRRLGVETDQQFYTSALASGHTLVVGASDETGNFPVSASFSSPNAKADVAAPGVNIDIITQDGVQTTGSGTSYAAPAAAVLVAKIRANDPETTPSEIELLLKRTTNPIFGLRNEAGSGTINPENALGYLVADKGSHNIHTITPDDAQATVSRTSFTPPVVTAAPPFQLEPKSIASPYPDITPSELKLILERTAEPILLLQE